MSGGHRAGAPLVFGGLMVVVGNKRRSEELIRWLRWRLGCSTPVCKTAVFLLSCRAGGGRYGAGGSGVRLPATVDVALLVLA